MQNGGIMNLKAVKLDAGGEIAQLLGRLRLRSGMSIAEAARKSGNPDSLIIGWEAGYPIPFVDLVVLISIYEEDTQNLYSTVTSFLKRIIRRIHT
jgi:transcriptional regulator with XRE-family HTH domain